MTVIDKDDVKDRVLTENTAQGILKHLRDFESNRARTQSRWIWELLQNARDASVGGDMNLVASIEVSDTDLVFRHNGRGFTVEEVAHLVFHGSTKLEDDNTIGQYGSGLLTTHLLSPAMDVSGQLYDGTPFQFHLKREISSVAALSDSMDQAWTGFCDSIDRASSDSNSSTPATSGTFTTWFKYPLDADTHTSVLQGIESLERCGPLVVAFNRQFRRIDISTHGKNTCFEVIDRAPSHRDYVHTVTVRVGDHGFERQQEYLLAEGTKVSLSVPIMQASSIPQCLPLEDVPKLFLGFPLIGTEAFSFPAVVHSLAFTPTEDRDGVYLGQSGNEANKMNQEAVEEACELHIKLMEFMTERQYAHIHTLAEIPAIHDETWLKRDWIYEKLCQLVAKIRSTEVVRNGQTSMRPRDSILPLAERVEHVETLWDLLYDSKELRPRLPERSEAAGWCRAVKSWEALEGLERASMVEGYDGNKLGTYIDASHGDSTAGFGTLEELQIALHDGVDAVQWLDTIYRFLESEGLHEVMESHHIILDQAGYLDRLSNLHRDDNVDEELKAIADDVLDLKVRQRLRDTRLSSLVDEIGKGSLSNKEVAHEVADKLHELCSEDSVVEEFATASPRFMAWVVANEQWNHLTRYPAYSTKPDDGGCELLWIGNRSSDDAELPLAPIGVWAEDLQRYADLFPWQYIMASAFLDAMPDEDVWRVLNEHQYVRTDVIFSVERSIGDFLPELSLPDVEHRTVDAVSVTDLNLLTRHSVGVMARVRDSQARARLFWRFLTEWLVTRDPEGLEPRMANCECGEIHAYYQAMWLVPVVRNRWVPQGNDRRALATAQSLAELLRGNDWTPDSLDDTAAMSRLLDAIHVTRLDLLRHFIVDDDESRSALDNAITDILVSTGGDLSPVREFVEDMKTDENLQQHLAERRERRRIVHQNQRLGSLVEDLVREGLEGEGFTVRRTGIGSDFEIEHDVIEMEEEIGIELSRIDKTWLIEVKATRERSVRMTAKQAETAVNEGDRFLLCVVCVGLSSTILERDDVLANMRFVDNMGPRLEPLCVELDVLNDLRDDATASSGSDISLEIEAGTARIRVDDTVWQDGIRLGDLSSHLRGN